MWNPFSDSAKGAVEGLGSAVAKAVGAFKADPTKLVEFEAAIQQATLKFQADTIIAVNTTMQAEAKSEHWMQWAWRPTFGFTACAILVNNYILLPYLVHFGVVVINIPSEVWLMIMAVLGVAAWTRGRDKP
jgi:roadblock/LC7 domain-containing protein